MLYYANTMDVKKRSGEKCTCWGGKTRFITVPASVAGDSLYPFEDGEPVIVSIEDGGLRVKKIPSEEKA